MSFRIHAETNVTELVPTTTADTATELGCGRWQTPRPACVVRSLRLGSGVCVLRAAEPARRRSREGWGLCYGPGEVYPSSLPQNLKRREGLICCGMASDDFLYGHTSGRDVRLLSKSGGGSLVRWTQKGREKQSDHLYGDPQTFRALNECVRFFPGHKRPDNLK